MMTAVPKTFMKVRSLVSMVRERIGSRTKALLRFISSWQTSITTKANHRQCSCHEGERHPIGMKQSARTDANCEKEHRLYERSRRALGTGLRPNRTSIRSRPPARLGSLSRDSAGSSWRNSSASNSSVSTPFSRRKSQASRSFFETLGRPVDIEMAEAVHEILGARRAD